MSLHRSALRHRALPASATTSATTSATATSPRTTATILAASAIGALVVGTLFAPGARAETAATAATIDRDNRTLFTWTGRVDREVFITMRGRDVRTSGTDARLGNRTRVNEALPRNRGDVVVRLQNGRGDVQVVEQPSQRNGYTTTIRVRDDRSGADNYSLVAYWRGDDDRNGRNDRNDRNDRRDDDRWDNRQGSNGRGGGWGPPAGRGNDRNDRDNRNDRNDRGGRDDRGGRQDNGSLRWSGRVDDVVEIRISGRRAETITRSGVRVSNVNSNVRGDGLPNRSVNVTVDRHSGRGSVRVVQQPAAWNNYTAVIRIDDSAGGAAQYDFTAYW